MILKWFFNLEQLCWFYHNSYHLTIFSSQLNHWLGQNDRAVEWTWQYLNATPTCSGVFLNWDDGQPNGEATQNCITMDKNGVWQDKDCTDNYYVTCKIRTGTEVLLFSAHFYLFFKCTYSFVIVNNVCTFLSFSVVEELATAPCTTPTPDGKYKKNLIKRRNNSGQ